jgi:hypothetical protein
LKFLIGKIRFFFRLLGRREGEKYSPVLGTEGADRGVAFRRRFWFVH